MDKQPYVLRTLLRLQELGKKIIGWVPRNPQATQNAHTQNDGMREKLIRT